MAHAEDLCAAPRCRSVPLAPGSFVFMERRGDSLIIDDQPCTRRDSIEPLVFRGFVHRDSGAEAVGAAVICEGRAGSALVRPLGDEQRETSEFLSSWGLQRQPLGEETVLSINDERLFWLRFIPRLSYAECRPWNLDPGEFAGSARFHALSRAIGPPRGRQIDHQYLEEYNAYRALRDAGYRMAIDEYRRCFPEIASSVRVALDATPETARYLYQAALRMGERVEISSLGAFPDLVPYARDGRPYERTSPGANSPERERFREIFDGSVQQLGEATGEIEQYEARLAQCKSAFSPYGKTYRNRLDHLHAQAENLKRRRRFAASVLARAADDDARFELALVSQLNLLDAGSL